MEDEDFKDFEEVEVIYCDEVDDVGDDIDNEDVVEDVENVCGYPDSSKLTFIKHSKSVFSSALSTNGYLAATGGEDDAAYLWDINNGDIKLECTGHKDSVTSVGFNHDCQLLATADMSGLIQVWDLKNFKLIWCHEGDDMEWLTWHPSVNVLIFGSQSGEVFIWQIPQGNCKMLSSHGSPCTCGKILSDGKHILCGYEDGQVKLWDIKASSVEWQFLDVSKKNTSSVEVNLNNTLCSLAPSSTLLKLTDGKPIGTLLIEGESDIEVHAFSDELNLLITGSLSGVICAWDLNTKNLRHQAKLNYGITILKLGLNGKALFGSTDGVIYMYDTRTGVFGEIFTGHSASILSMCVCYVGNFLLSTSDDTTAKIFSVQFT